MDCTIVHDDNRLGGRERLHFEDDVRDERGEEITIERSLDNHALDDAIIERDRRKNRVPMISSEYLRYDNIGIQYLLPRAKYCFLHARSPSKAQARFRRYVLLSQVLSSTNTSCSGV